MKRSDILFFNIYAHGEKSFYETVQAINNKLSIKFTNRQDNHSRKKRYRCLCRQLSLFERFHLTEKRF